MARRQLSFDGQGPIHNAKVEKRLEAWQKAVEAHRDTRDELIDTHAKLLETMEEEKIPIYPYLNSEGKKRVIEIDRTPKVKSKRASEAVETGDDAEDDSKSGKKAKEGKPKKGASKKSASQSKDDGPDPLDEVRELIKNEEPEAAMSIVDGHPELSEPQKAKIRSEIMREQNRANKKSGKTAEPKADKPSDEAPGN